MSEFAVEVVPIKMHKHPNADSLSIVQVRGYAVCVRTEDWEDGQLAAYIPPDSVVPDTDQFSFLGGHLRIKAKKLRGIYSMGMLVPAPEGAEIGDDVAEQLQITHYEPPIKWFQSGKTGSLQAESPPAGFKPHYDVENFYRYPGMFVPGELVFATEKIHGANGRWTFQDGRFWAGSRNEWKIEDAGSLWWVALNQCENLKNFLIDHPGITVYGEVYGCVQDLTYGHINGSVSIAVFDLWHERLGFATAGWQHQATTWDISRSELPSPGWIDHEDAIRIAHSLDTDLCHWVPLVYFGPFDEDKLKEMSMGDSLIPGAKNIREGIVVIPLKERYVYDLGAGRLQLKFVSPEYLEKSK